MPNRRARPKYDRQNGLKALTLYQRGVSFTDIGQILGTDGDNARAWVALAARHERYEELRATAKVHGWPVQADVRAAPLSRRALDVLLADGITSIGELKRVWADSCRRKALRRHPNFGLGTEAAISTFLNCGRLVEAVGTESGIAPPPWSLLQV